MPFPRPCLLRTGALGKARRSGLRIEQDHVLRCGCCRGPMLPNSGALSLGGVADWRSLPFPLDAHRAAAVYFGSTWPERAGSHHHSTSFWTRGSRLLAPSARGLLQILITKSPQGGRHQADRGDPCSPLSSLRRLLLRKRARRGLQTAQNMRQSNHLTQPHAPPHPWNR